MKVNFEATEQLRLDVFVTESLRQLLDDDDFELIVPTRTKIAKWIVDGRVRTNRLIVKRPSFLVKNGDLVELDVPPPEKNTLSPDPSVVLDILYEDLDLLILNKQADLVVHPGAGQKEKTLVHGILAYLGSDWIAVGDELRPGIVHRLDRDTTGVMVVAKTDFAYHELVKQFVPPRTIKRSYLALTRKLPKFENTICATIGRSTADRKKMAVVKNGKEAITHWGLVSSLAHGYFLSLELETGRTHQIRVHLSHAGAPIVGDLVYGEHLSNFPPFLASKIKKFSRQALHASRLNLIHPRTGEEMEFISDIPSDFKDLVDAFKF
jgi:23S rRNA pseudouridine1911/1915/1917 synthase